VPPRILDQACVQAGKSLLAMLGVAGDQQSFKTCHVVGNCLGAGLLLIMPEVIKKGGGQGREFSPDTHMGIALACLAMETARVQAPDVEAAEERFALVDDEQLAMVALQVLEWISGPEGIEPLELAARPLEVALQVANGPESCAEAVEVQMDVTAGTCLAHQGGNEPLSDLICGKDVGFHADVILGALDCLDHRIIEFVAFDEEPKRATACT
jgi:hypothetical protein